MPMLKINERSQYLHIGTFHLFSKQLYILSLLLNTVCNMNVLKLYDCLLNVSVHGFMAPSFDWLAACSPALFS